MSFDARTYWTRGHNQTWADELAAGNVTVKAILSLWIYPQRKDIDNQINELKAMYKNGRTRRLRSNSLITSPVLRSQ